MMKTISTDVIVRRDLDRGKNKKLEDLLPFDETAWCHLCKLAYLHTLLVDKISEKIKQNPALLNWIFKTQNVQENSVDTESEQRGDWLNDLTQELRDSLAEQTPFEGNSDRFYASAIDRVKKIFKGWIVSKQKLIWKIKGKRRWLAVLESDIELAKISNFSAIEIEDRAKQVLAQIESKNESTDELDNIDHRLFNFLFSQYEATKEVLTRRAIILLLKNNGKVRAESGRARTRKNQKKSEKPLTPEERLMSKQVEIERLEKQLLNQLPRARNLLPDWAFEESLENLITLVDPSSTNYDRYYLLVFLLLIHQSESCKYIQFEQYILKLMYLQCRKTDSLLRYKIFIFSFLLQASSIQKYLQLGRNLLQLIVVESERVESQFFDWYEAITPKLEEFLREPKSLPYPMSFGYDSVRSWRTNQQDKIFFKLNGWGDLIFEVRCHHRQLSLLKTFLKDWQTKNNSKDKKQYTGSFMLLRSIELIWKPKRSSEHSSTQLCSECEIFQQYPGQGFWDGCKLSIHWTYDSDGLTKQGLEKIRQRKLASQLDSLSKKQEKLDKKQELLSQLEQKTPEDRRSETQAKRIENLRKAIEDLQTNLAKPKPKLDCLKNSPLFDRPDHPPYEGIPNIFVGVLLDLDKHIVVAVVDAMRHKVLAIRNTRSISKQGYDLLQKYFRQRQDHSKQRQVDQKAERHIHLSESGLGQQVARLFAKGLVELAQKFQASAIVIPNTDGWRDRLYSQLVARARIKCKGVKKAMDQYTKAHGRKLHQWDYRRLSKAILDRAATDGVKIIQQKSVFEEDAFQQAANLAIAAYDSLNSAKE